ncbi:MAG: FtsQ-type POTRA domain-containing protein [Clostridia bacterium]|nr:FtsQ-type POTRA domain-containing protein [Clostridia bacterium]
MKTEDVKTAAEAQKPTPENKTETDASAKALDDEKRRSRAEKTAAAGAAARAAVKKAGAKAGRRNEKNGASQKKETDGKEKAGAGDPAPKTAGKAPKADKPASETEKPTAKTEKPTAKTEKPATKKADAAKPASPEKRSGGKGKRKKRKKRAGDKILRLALIVFLAAVGIAACVLMFRVKVINVSNTAIRYSDGDIAAASGLENNVGMFTFSAENVGKKIEAALPYIGTAKVIRHFPSTVELAVTYAAPAFALEAEGGYTLISADCKVLETGVTRPGEYVPVLTGAAVSAPVPGEPASFGDEETAQTVTAFAKAIAESGVYSLTAVDLSDPGNVRAVIDYFTEVQLGGVAQAAEKLPFALEVDKRYRDEKPETGFLAIDLTDAKKAVTSEKTTRAVKAPEATSAGSELVSAGPRPDTERVTEPLPTEPVGEGVSAAPAADAGA